MVLGAKPAYSRLAAHRCGQLFIPLCWPLSHAASGAMTGRKVLAKLTAVALAVAVVVFASSTSPAAAQATSKGKTDAEYEAQLRSASATGAETLSASTVSATRTETVSAAANTVVATSVAGGQDSVGDGNPVTFCQGDITSFGASYSTTVGIWLTTACGSSPTGANWTPGITHIIWSIDVNGDGIDDYSAFFENFLGVTAPVYFTNGDFVRVCDATPNWDGNAAFSTTFSPSCIGNPSSFRAQAYMVWDENPFGSTCICPYDVAPNGFGHSAPVVQTIPPPPPPPPPPPAVAHWYLHNGVGPGAGDIAFAYGLRRYTPVVGDWDGNGTQTAGVFDNGTWYLRNSNAAGGPDIVINYGAAGYTPVVGDWDGNGTDTLGVYYNGFFYLRNSNTPGPPDIVINYGAAGYTPVVGDWDGNGTDTLGVYYNGFFYLRNSNTPGPPDIVINYGAAGYTPVVGDWDGNGTDTLGVFVSGWWYLRNMNTGGAPDISANYGAAGYTPIVGRWTGTVDGFGVVT